MNKNFITIIVVITTFSLLGVVVTQFFWAERAINIRTKQFNNSIYFGLVTVIDKVNDIKKDSVFEQLHKSRDDSVKISQNTNLNYPNLLDSLIIQEFGCLKIKEDYSWGIIDTVKHVVVYGHYDEQHTEAMFSSTHQYSASEIFNNQKQFILSIYFPEQKQLIIHKMFLWVLILSGIFLLIVIVTFLVFIYVVLRQKKVSEMRVDFINNMTHEFKTPISTISVASEMLMKPSIQSSPEKTHRYANIIFDENMRIRNQVEQVLHISMLEKSQLKLNISRIDIHKILENTIEVFNVILKKKNGMILSDLYATKSEIEGDEVHIINLVSNLMDNAVKYSFGRPEIRILTRDSKNGIEIIISDKGMGISSENLKHVLKKFYRVHTGDRHDVKGFGLGLYYVKTVVDAHGGFIHITSELKKGSTFEVYLPYKFKIVRP